MGQHVGLGIEPSEKLKKNWVQVRKSSLEPHHLNFRDSVC
jgi:hypothetical protein